MLGEMDRRGKSLMHVAVEAGSMDVVQHLVATYPDVSLNIKDRFAFVHMICYFSLNLIFYFYRDGWTVLHAACASVSTSHKNLRMIEFLIETRRCDVKCRYACRLLSFANRLLNLSWWLQIKRWFDTPSLLRKKFLRRR